MAVKSWLIDKSAFVRMPTSPDISTWTNRIDRGLGLLAEKGQHRAPSLADLLIAATAERNGFIVLHLDKDFELIASVTGQPVERLRLLEGAGSSA